MDSDQTALVKQKSVYITCGFATHGNIHVFTLINDQLSQCVIFFPNI